MTLTTQAIRATCRLCGGETTPAFRAVVLGRHEADYVKCVRCESLQPAEPHWLEEAYRNEVRSAFDVGAASRILVCQSLTYAVARLFRVRGRLLDFGGGDGLLCRLLRNVGFDAYTADKYSDVRYAKGFEAQLGPGFELVTAYEVLEHFLDPRAELASLFEGKPRLVLATTGLYRGEGADWPYLAKETGQHVFLYSPRAIRLIGERHGYDTHIGSWFILWSSERFTSAQRMGLRLFLASKMQRFIQAWLGLLPRRGIARDFAALAAARAK